MANSADLETRIGQLDWNGLRTLWTQIATGNANDWDAGKALEYLVIRAFEIDPAEKATVRYP
jgi:hypothetical protein